MRRALPLLFLCAVLLPAPPAAARAKANQLLRVIEPAGRSVASAHPFVNVLFRFGSGKEGTADAASFRARLGGVDVAPLFQPVVENGAVVGMRAALGPALLVPGRRRANRLRAEVRGRSLKGKRIHDADVLRFRSADLPDEGPTAHALIGSGSGVLLPDVPLPFDATGSVDPEGDVLTYHWDFGDGTSSDDPKPTHVFAASDVDVTVRLTVSDGQLEGHDEATMLSVPVLPPGRTPGVLKVEAPGPLEFNAVPLGQMGTLSFTVRNTDTVSSSDLIVHLGSTGGAFLLGTDMLDLGAGESAPVELAFAPTADGHQTAEITLVASSSNSTSAHFLSHGHGGAAPGTGPIPTAESVFFSTLAGGTTGMFPSGARFVADTNVHTCMTPQNGPGFLDYCLTDTDCAANRGTCALVGSCLRGDRAGQSCGAPADCPNGFCSSVTPFDPVKMCGDGEGGLYMTSDAGSYTDPNPTADTELTGTLMHVRFDGNGNRVGAEIVERTTDGTTQVACDKIPASAIPSGQIYIAEDITVPPSSCFRDTREALIAKRKSNGSESVLIPRIDAVEGLDACNDDFDPVDDLEVTRDGSAVFVALPNGVSRVRPDPGNPLLMTPDVDDLFQVHPDGSVLVVASADQGPTGLLRLYKISVDQAVTGAPHLSDLTPCATVTVPNNRGGNPGRVTTFISFAADPVSFGSGDATVLLSFLAGGGSDVLSSSLRVRGTVAISSPAGSPTCAVLGLVNLEPLDLLTF